MREVLTLREVVDCGDVEYEDDDEGFDEPRGVLHDVWVVEEDGVYYAGYGEFDRLYESDSEEGLTREAGNYNTKISYVPEIIRLRLLAIKLAKAKDQSEVKVTNRRRRGTRSA